MQAAAPTLLTVTSTVDEGSKKRRRRCWMSQLYASRNVPEENPFLKCDLSVTQFINFCRMDASDFENLLQLIAPRVTKKNTTFRMSITAKEKLAVTLRYLATGESFSSLTYLFKMSSQSISRSIFDVCKSIIIALKNYVKLPRMPEGWMKYALGFENAWNFPNAVGAISGKHIVVLPTKTGSAYSIILFAVVDADHNFMFADLGSEARLSDKDAFEKSALFKKILERSLSLPCAKPLPGRSADVPFVFLANEAFSLHENVMKSYVNIDSNGLLQRAYNYRHSRVQNVAENALGLLSAVFKVLQKPLILSPYKAAIVVLSTVYLHNFLMKNSSRQLYLPPGVFDSYQEGKLIEGSWRKQNEEEPQSFLNILPTEETEPPMSAENIRKEFANYFTNEGRIAYQDEEM